jgi:hypothetical protein
MNSRPTAVVFNTAGPRGINPFPAWPPFHAVPLRPRRVTPRLGFRRPLPCPGHIIDGFAAFAACLIPDSRRSVRITPPDEPGQASPALVSTGIRPDRTRSAAGTASIETRASSSFDRTMAAARRAA